MPMEQAKWYYICFDPTDKRGVYWWNRGPFYRMLFCYQLKEELGIKRISTRYYKLQVFCGWRKLNKIIKEAHLLGLEDELLIFERK